MAGKILKGLAVVGGTGLAIGFGSKQRTQAATQATTMSDSSDNIPAIEPLLDRLDRIEARMSAVEARPAADIAKEVPAILESLLVPHVADLRARLHAEMRESMEAGLTAFEQTIDDKISLRISMLEKALIDQSAIVTTLSQRAIEAEANFQRLISAVERLCERKEQPVLDLPFERQLNEAFQRQPASSALPLDSGFRPRIVKEDDPKLRHRNRLTGV
jgi:hypothetical protein